ncbi:transcriptional regulator [Kosakonia sacchari]|nr:transcriptional regulator [Kosakonia sacchari]
METQAIRQLNPRIVLHAGSLNKQMKLTLYRFAGLSWRQVIGHSVGLVANVIIICLMDKTKSLRMYGVI